MFDRIDQIFTKISEKIINRNASKIQRSSHLGDLRLQPRDVLLEVGDELVELRLGLARPRAHGLGRVLRLLALLDEAEVLVLQVREDGEQLLGLTEEQTDVLLEFCWNGRKIFLLLVPGNWQH